MKNERDNEKFISYIKERLETGRMPEAIEIANATGIELSKEELKNYIYKYLEKGWMYSGMMGV